MRSVAKQPSPEVRTNNDAGSIKAEGATYTPSTLASFVAREMLKVAKLPSNGPILLLDPAMGDGALLHALLTQLQSQVLRRIIVRGYDTDPVAVSEGQRRLTKRYPGIQAEFLVKDFLGESVDQQYHLVIANPPYVRTQIMGATQARHLAEQFGLSGRVDLYFPFLLAIAKSLNSTGTAGVITSNRFLTTKSGQAVRRALLERFRIRHVYDLGDTKLFDAAVLPAITIAQGLGTDASVPNFSSVYETGDENAALLPCLWDALASSTSGVVKSATGTYEIRHGVLDSGGRRDDVWRVSTGASDRWLTTVEQNTWKTFSHIGKVRVGVKSTADDIFIRSDWQKLPTTEPELLRPLVTRVASRRYKSLDQSAADQPRILYTHYLRSDGRRAPVQLDRFPAAKKYLEQFKDRLASRKYVVDAGRNWFEIWVPQDPSLWERPKLVFPDICERPTAWIDPGGSVVNGECYFVCCDPEEQDLLQATSQTPKEDLLWLALAIANSSFVGAFYDHRFNNKLYSGRRRFITQYVEHFPLPDPKRAEVREIIGLAKKVYERIDAEDAQELDKELNTRVWQAFGLLPEDRAR